MAEMNVKAILTPVKDESGTDDNDVSTDKRAETTDDPPPKNPSGAGAATTSLSPFDPRSLRLGQDFAASLGVRKALLTIPRRKPDRQWFFRVHPSPDYRIETALLVLKEDREVYLVDRALWSALPNEVTPSVLFTAMNRQGVLFVLPVTLPGADGKWNAWHKSLFDAAELAQVGWVRAAPNMSLGAYDVYEASGDLPAPNWPELPFSKVLETAFKDAFIHDEGHPVLRRLRGEA